MQPLALALAALTATGCSAIDRVLRDVAPPVVRLEVWNRTLDAMTLTDANGAELEVAACGHAIAGSFRVDGVRVHTKVGYVWGFGSGGEDAGSGRQYLVIVATDGESYPTPVAPVALPPCAGHPNAQPGVFLDPWANMSPEA